jgi:hypothetical protein
LDHCVIERLNVEVMRGFGVTRRRGTETGGLLIGKIGRRAQPVIHIQDYEIVPCEYASGPSYILSANDRLKFKETAERWQPSLERDLYAVGYFRSHTRDGFAFDEKDAALFREYFQDPLDVALLIKPFATRSASAGFFLQEKGSLVTSASPLEFTFAPGKVRDEPSQQAPDTAPTLVAPVPKTVAPPAPPPPAGRPKSVERSTPRPSYDRPMFAEHQLVEPSAFSRLSWIAFSLALLAFGGVCGYEYARVQAEKQGLRALSPGASPGSKAPGTDLYSVNLQVVQADSNLIVKWDREAAPIQAALSGALTVTEGNNSKEVKLGFAELRNGTAMYPHAGSEVRFRLELFFKENRSFIESALFRGAP